jgi:hypothetical protein
MERFGYERKRPSNDLSFHVAGRGGPHFDAMIIRWANWTLPEAACRSDTCSKLIGTKNAPPFGAISLLHVHSVRFRGTPVRRCQPPRRRTSQPHRPSVDKLRATAEEEPRRLQRPGALNSGSSLL